MSRNKKWDKESVIKEASKYQLKADWKKNSPSSYRKARTAGWLIEASSHMIILRKKNKWDKSSILEEAKKFRTRSEWIQKSPSSYNAASKNNLLKEASAHMVWISHRNKWNENSIKKEMSKYSSIKEWANNSPGSYEAAKKLNIEWRGKKLWNKRWTKQLVLESSLKYKNITSWIDSLPGAYKAAVKFGIVEECCAHMKVLGGRSTMENELMEKIRTKFPKANRISMPNNDDSFVAKRFHLDIYIPELNKGIEFDGTYWHSFKALKRGRPKWTDDQIKNYHLFKDMFFKSKNIDIIHIEEKEWVQNKEFCLKKIDKFLNLKD